MQERPEITTLVLPFSQKKKKKKDLAQTFMSLFLTQKMCTHVSLVKFNKRIFESTSRFFAEKPYRNEKRYCY